MRAEIKLTHEKGRLSARCSVCDGETFTIHERREERPVSVRCSTCGIVYPTNQTKPTRTNVVCRTFPDGDVIVLFPELPGSIASPHYMQCLGPDGISSASLDVIDATRPASPEEYEPLLEEIHRRNPNGEMGELVVRKRISAQMTAERDGEWKRLYQTKGRSA